MLYELIGPGCGKLALYLSGSYSNKLEDLVTVNESTPEGAQKTELELLIERINKIQEEIPKWNVNEDEHAFTEEAERHFKSLQQENLASMRGMARKPKFSRRHK